jgi:hypothetical protein
MGVINSVKALIMILIKNKQFDLLLKLKLPCYVETGVMRAIERFYSDKNKENSEKIKYLYLYKIFGINANQYDRGRKKFISEFILPKKGYYEI